MLGKLNEILEAAEAQHPFSHINFVSIRKLTFLWIIGNNAQEMGRLLTEERRKIVDDERTICIIHNDAGRISGQEVYEQFRKGIDRAGQNYLNVDLFQLMVCPVFLPGCFETEEEKEQFQEAVLYLQKEMAERQIYLEWSPFLLVEHERVHVLREQVYRVTDLMETIMEDGRLRNRNCCCPCCLISDINERGLAISNEQKAKIILMLTVFRNTACENGQFLDTVFQPLQEGEQDYFFTGRAISICEPVKSLVLNRFLAIHKFFFQGMYPQKKIFSDWRHCFFESSVWKKHLDHVAHDEHYHILTAPIYSNVPVPDSEKFLENLKKFGRKFYLDPLESKEEQMLKEWWKSFWEEYFLKAGGSVKNLDNLEENIKTILDKVPNMGIRNDAEIFINDLRRECETWIGRTLQNYPRILIEKGFQPDGTYMKCFRDRKKWIQDATDMLKTVIKNQEQRLQQTELLLNTGGGHIANPQQEAEDWFWDYLKTEGKEIQNIYDSYQKFMYEIFQKSRDELKHNCNALQCELMDIYSKVIAGSIESREEYMKTKLANLAGTDMAQLIQKLGESWLYPIRLIGSDDNDAYQKLFVMGSRENYLCQKILEQPNYRVAFKESRLDDRLEIVRVSDKFSRQRIFTEEQG